MLGSLFFSIFYKESFWLIINGNRGFVGKFLQNHFFIQFNEIEFRNIAYYILILLVLSFFLLSLNFKLSLFIRFIKNIITKFFLKKEKI